MSRRLGLALAVLLSCALVAPRAHAYNTFLRTWSSQQIVLNYNDGSFGSSGLDWTTSQNQLATAAGTWTQPGCTLLSMTLGSSTTTAYAYDGENVIYWESDLHGWRDTLFLDSATYAWTIDHWPADSFGVIDDSDVIFNGTGITDPSGTAEYWSSNAGASDEIDFQSIALHEFGHVLGLDHNGTPGASVMFPVLAGGRIERSLHPDDVNGVCFLYPNPFSQAGMSAECTTDHDCATGTCAFDGTNHTCAYACTGDCDCPTGNTCMATATAGVSVCATGTNSCPMTGTHTFAQNGAACMRGVDCLSGLCYTPATGTAYCTRRCASDCDCNASFRCDATAGVCVTGTSTAMCGPDGGVGPDGGGGTPPASHGGCAVARGTDGAAAWCVALGVAIAMRVRRRRRA